MVRTLGDTCYVIKTGDRLLSANGHFELLAKPDGDIVINQLVGKRGTLWSAKHHYKLKKFHKAAKHGIKETFLIPQAPGGNVVFYVRAPDGNAHHVWSSCTENPGQNEPRLKLHNNGNLYAYRNLNDPKSSYWSIQINIDTSFYTEKEKLEKELKNIKQIVTTQNNKLQRANQQISKLTTEINKLTNENNQLRGQVEILNKQMEKVIDDSQNLTNNIDLIKQYTESNNKLNSRIKILENKVKTLTNLLSQKTKDEIEMNTFKNKFNVVTQLLSKLVLVHT